MNRIENLTFTEAVKLAHLGWNIKRPTGSRIIIGQRDVHATDWVAIDEGNAVG